MVMMLSRLFRRTVTFIAFFIATTSYGALAECPQTSVSLDRTLTDAYKLAATRADLQVLRIEGRSMLPFFGSGSVVIVKKMDSAKLRTGMVVVYRNRFNETVAHRLVAATNDGWVAQGYNNADVDSTPVTGANLIGVVYATFHSNGQTGSGKQIADLLNRTQVAYAAVAK